VIRCVALALFASAALAACETPCHGLGYQVCACEPEPTLVQDCEKRVRDALSSEPPSAADQQVCRQLSSQCAEALKGDGGSCAALRTPEGKRACGLAY
jgi:hypothetical protein